MGFPARHGGTPSYHPFLDGSFPDKVSSYWGTPIYGNPHIWTLSITLLKDPPLAKIRQDDASDVVQLALDLLSEFPPHQEDRRCEEVRGCMVIKAAFSIASSTGKSLKIIEMENMEMK